MEKLKCEKLQKEESSPEERKLAEYFKVVSTENLILRKFSVFGCTVKFGLYQFSVAFLKSLHVFVFRHFSRIIIIIWKNYSFRPENEVVCCYFSIIVSNERNRDTKNNHLFLSSLTLGSFRITLLVLSSLPKCLYQSKV